MFMLGAKGWRRLWWGSRGALLGFSSLLGAAHAQSSSDPAAARALFAEGRKLLAKKDYEHACPKFEESQRLDSGIGTMYNLADCWEHTGRTASAWAMFLDAAAAARAANQAERAKAAKDRAAVLEPKLAHLTIRLASVDPGLEIKRDGQIVGSASYDIPVPVDPGPHRIDVVASGKKPFTTSVEVATSASVSVQIPKLEPGDPAAPAASPAVPAGTGSAASAGQSTVPPSAAEPGASAAPSKALPYALLGVGVVGAAVGTVFEIKSRSTNSDASRICVGDGACTQDDIDRHTSKVSDAKKFQTVAIIGAGVGAASLVAAIVLLTTHHATADKSTASTWSLDWSAGASGGALIAKGSF